MFERELQRLDRRINWLARSRRTLSVVSAAIVSLLVVTSYTGWSFASWPDGFAFAVALTFALFAWYIVGLLTWYAIEALLGSLIALWETDYSTLTRRPGLPRAEVVRRK